jgi:DNA-binding transcriptional regulator YiaG
LAVRYPHRPCELGHVHAEADTNSPYRFGELPAVPFFILVHRRFLLDSHIVSAHNTYMGKNQAYQIRDTPLTWAIRSMRRRMRMGQVKFTRLVCGKYTSGIVSRWESGQMMPQTGNLLCLLRCAETPEETAPILEALKSQGINWAAAAIQPHVACLRQPGSTVEIGSVEPSTAPDVYANPPANEPFPSGRVS